MKPDSEISLETARGINIDVLTFGHVDYQESYTAMASFASSRPEDAADQIWLLQHPPVYTQGTACDLNALLPSDIPIVKTDRGGQITYHGPGQIVMYPLINLKQHGIGIKSLVAKLEQAMIDVLAGMEITGLRREDAPGVYVDGKKIGALGLRIRRGTSYHGLSLNVDMDLAPFNNIDPCGYQGLQVTQVVEYINDAQQNLIAMALAKTFVSSL